MTDDTIAAIATARGRSALAVVRLAGPQAVPLAASVFSGVNLNTVAPNTVHFGRVVRPGGAVVDEVLVTVFRAPRSYTGEDLVEISCHGGDLAVQGVLQAVTDAGARHAEPGEFTRRAFVNGKMDLAQAEAVADLIHASSSAAHRISLDHLQGRYSERLSRIRAELLDAVTLVEVGLDFSDEDVPFIDAPRLRNLLADTDRRLAEIQSSVRLGAFIRDGVRVAIVGRPNAGKSSLLNALLGRERAIVSPVPGTTRDEIEADLELDGLLFRFVDTAGLRRTDEAIEAEGVRRAERAADAADLVLYVYDLNLGLGPDETAFISKMNGPKIVIGNKRDLAKRDSQPVNGTEVALSAVLARENDAELGPLFDLMVDRVRAAGAGFDGSTVVVNQRHVQHLADAREAIGRALADVTDVAPGERVSSSIREALYQIGAITGEITNEDILSNIFSRFCIGK